MKWLFELWRQPSVAHDVVVLCLVILCGLALGNLKVRGIGLGLAGVLFAGLAFAHFGAAINEETLHFLREFGLIMFVYGIGLQVGPGFWASLRQQGLVLNALAATFVLLGAAVAVAIALWGKVPITVAAGLFAGATTNTPSLAAVQSTLATMPNITADAARLPGVGYAIAYPFGVLGIILTMVMVRAVFRIDVEREARVLDKKRQRATPHIETRNIEVLNQNLNGVALSRVPLLDSSLVVSRVMHDNRVEIASSSTTLQTGDILLGVGEKHRLDALQMLVGAPADFDLKTVPTDIITRRLLVTQTLSIGKMLRELNIWDERDVTFTRVRRLELEFAAAPDFRLQFGDSVLAVGKPEAVEKAARALGDDAGRFDAPQLLPVFIGIVLGVLLGSVPWPFPGVPEGVKLGLAGGPLLVALFLSRVGRFGPVVFYLPKSANAMMREIGIVLFLACAGLKSGATFVSTLTQGDGFFWMGYGALITLIPLIVVSLLARLWAKLPFATLCGLLAGSSTDPPALAFANTMNSSPAVSLSYATVYPLVMLLRVVVAQLMIVIFAR